MYIWLVSSQGANTEIDVVVQLMLALYKPVMLQIQTKIREFFNQ